MFKLGLPTLFVIEGLSTHAKYTKSFATFDLFIGELGNTDSIFLTAFVFLYILQCSFTSVCRGVSSFYIFLSGSVLFAVLLYLYFLLPLNFLFILSSGNQTPFSNLQKNVSLSTFHYISSGV